MPAPITVKRPNPETGELIQHIVPADHFKPRRPKLPRLDESKITVIQRGSAYGPTGRSVVYMATHREREIEYWEEHATCLTREERSKLARGQATAVLRPIPAGWEKGDRVDVANNVEAEVYGEEETARGYRTTFRIVDFRPLLPKRIVGGSSKPKTDDQGYPIEHLDETEEQRARVDGAYTTSRALAVADTDDELDDELHQRLHAEASMARAMSGAKRRKRVTLIAIEERLNTARKKYRAGEVRYLERQRESLKRKEAKAKRAAA